MDYPASFREGLIKEQQEWERNGGSPQTGPFASFVVQLGEEQEEWERKGGPSRNGPLFVFFANVRLDELRKEFERGNQLALMLGLRQCALHDLVMPEWVARAYMDRCDLVLNYHAASWDEVFGSPLKKGQHLSALRQRREMKHEVFRKVRDILRRNPKTPIDATLFTEVGNYFGIKKTLCERYYYAVVKQMNWIAGEAMY